MNVLEPPPTPHLDWLFALQRFGMRPGLEAMRALLYDLGSPQEALRCVLVAGTNGKGSVARVLAGCLAESGRRTGLYTSPHLQRIGERVQVDLVASTDEDLEEVAAAVRPAAEKHENTFFEVMTAAALLRFAIEGVQWAVLEVGLGGRLDATNVVEPELACLTTVALDHAAVLGGTLEAIAFEKAGIMREGVPAVSGVSGQGKHVVEDRAAVLGAPLASYGREFWGEDVDPTWDGVEFTLRRTGQVPGDGLRLRSPLVGRHQVLNVGVAAEAALTLGIDARTVLHAVTEARWPGRMESFWHEGRRVVLDGAHNPAAAAALAAAVRELEGGVAVLLLGASDDKDVRGVLTQLGPLARLTLLTRAARSPRAMTPQELMAHVPEEVSDVDAAPTPEAALRRAVEVAAPGETVLVAGSLFLVGEVRDLLTADAGEGRLRLQ